MRRNPYSGNVDVWNLNVITDDKISLYSLVNRMKMIVVSCKVDMFLPWVCQSKPFYNQVTYEIDLVHPELSEEFLK